MSSAIKKVLLFPAIGGLALTSVHGEPYQLPEAPPPSDRLYFYRAEVERVVDGDTIVIAVDLGFRMWLRGEHVRLARIDTPEPHTTTREEGDAATAFVEGHLPQGQDVIVQTNRDSEGKFGRYIVEVWVDGVNLNDLIVEEGHGVYRDY